MALAGSEALGEMSSYLMMSLAFPFVLAHLLERMVPAAHSRAWLCSSIQPSPLGVKSGARVGKDMPVTATGPLPLRPLRHVIIYWWSWSSGAVRWWNWGDEFSFLWCPFSCGAQQEGPGVQQLSAEMRNKPSMWWG